jgi:hypothetical protein
MNPTSRRALEFHITMVFFLVLVATVLYMVTLRQMRRLQPSYPSRIVLTVATPPGVFVKAHLMFPLVGSMGTVGLGSVAVYAARTVRPRLKLQLALFTLNSVMILAFIAVFAWAAYWCEKVFALLGTPS